MDDCVETVDAWVFVLVPQYTIGGCADIPQGDCDCNGSVLDSLGVCGVQKTQMWIMMESVMM